MTTTRYKPLFGISASYELSGLGVQTSGIMLNRVALSENKMADRRLKPQYKDNAVTVFYEGIETPPDAPLTSEPVAAITTDEYFYFLVGLSSKERISGLKFHSTSDLELSTGFPVLFDAAVPGMGGSATITSREEVKVMSPVFTFRVTAADTGISAGYATLTVKDENGNDVDLGLQPVALNDKSIDGPSAVPEFAFSIDASKLQAGIYEFTVGAVSKTYFLSNGIDLADAVALIRVLKNNFLEYKKDLSDKTFALFELQIPAA